MSICLHCYICLVLNSMAFVDETVKDNVILETVPYWLFFVISFCLSKWWEAESSIDTFHFADSTRPP